jgi:hypothetical protein
MPRRPNRSDRTCFWRVGGQDQPETPPVYLLGSVKYFDKRCQGHPTGESLGTQTAIRSSACRSQLPRTHATRPPRPVEDLYQRHSRTERRLARRPPGDVRPARPERRRQVDAHADHHDAPGARHGNDHARGPSRHPIDVVRQKDRVRETLGYPPQSFGLTRGCGTPSGRRRPARAGPPRPAPWWPGLPEGARG